MQERAFKLLFPAAVQDITPAEGEIFWEDGEFSDSSLEQVLKNCLTIDAICSSAELYM